MNLNQYFQVLVVVACLLTCSCSEEPFSENSFTEYANKRLLDHVEADGYSADEFYPGEVVNGYQTDSERNVRRYRTWIMKWKNRTENWSVGILYPDDGDAQICYFDDKPGGFGPKPGFQRGIKWLQQKPEQ
jgi:hypothetical protein